MQSDRCLPEMDRAVSFIPAAVSTLSASKSTGMGIAHVAFAVSCSDWIALLLPAQDSLVSCTDSVWKDLIGSSQWRTSTLDDRYIERSMVGGNQQRLGQVGGLFNLLGISRYHGKWHHGLAWWSSLWAGAPKQGLAG